MTILFCERQWRPQLERLVRGVKSELLIVCPFIKDAEADFIADRLGTNAHVRALTDLRMDSVVTNALDVEALLTLSRFSVNKQVLTLSGLHAKVFVADRKRAIITSGNLTQSGLDRNHEYGVAVSDAKMVGQVRRDMGVWMQASVAVDAASLKKIARLAKQAIKSRKQANLSKQELALQQAITEAQAVPRSVDANFIEAQDETRSVNAIFCDEILHLLQTRPAQATKQLKQAIQASRPNLCDDDLTDDYGRKEWKHTVGGALDHLKKKGRILQDEETKLWSIVTKNRQGRGKR